ncbi:Short-chain collagen C4 [Holothuria leucospilota]|uniref:Short-chain collagen C4 n=1 Tax=Holothuria leucospilota TaxID=206669 RepID=A0A9Q1CM84_HOLLE|nr:Short-chain collagen C4 [Holothuria leucospilota]
MLTLTFKVSLGDFRLYENGEEEKSNSINKIKEPLNILRNSSVRTTSSLHTNSQRSRRNVNEEAQISANVCPGCSSSYTPYFSGQCFLCPPGTPGPRGPPGQQGIPGRDGRDGRDATTESGNFGMSESPELPLDSLKNRNTSGGAVYVRWGRNDCPLQSELIYEGVAAGGHYTQKGSGSNYLCMPEEPIYDEPVAGSSGQNRGYVYGAEYETITFANWNHLHDNNVYCAVCWAPNRSSLMMVPARNICPGSLWTKEYSGYLVSSYYNHEGRTEFVCMDRNAEAVPRSSHSTDGALFYPVDGRCNSHGSGLPCGPYVDGYELTCAVCTR